MANDIKEMLAAWATIESAVAVQFPDATDEERYQLTASAMRHALGVAA